MVKPGPRVKAGEATRLVSSLRHHADEAASYVREVTELDAPRRKSEVLVVDRRSWLSANVASFEQALSRSGSLAQADLRAASPAQRLAARGSGVQIGTLLAYLSSKVLGQFDPFHRVGDRQGRLLLVAPNVLKVERDLAVDPEDFRLWVCLHEETHRVQFGHAPWLAEHLQDQMARLLGLSGDFTLTTAWRRWRASLASSDSPEGASLIELVSTPEQQRVIDQVSAVMSLLEGHADVMMDQVGPEVIPSVRVIRSRFNQRRSSTGPDRTIRRLLGLDAKMAQYREGAVFCRRVLDEVGTAGLNLAFTSPNTLPTMAEIGDPTLWLGRVGRGGSTPPSNAAGSV